MSTHTIPGRVFQQAKRRGDQPAYVEKIHGNWVTTSWNGYADQIRCAAKSLIDLGFQSGDKVCIVGYNRPEWVTFDIAAMAAGGAPAGIYTTSSAKEVQYIVNHAAARLVLVENREQWEKLEPGLDEMPSLEWVIVMRGAGHVEHEKVLSWESFLGLGDDGAHDEELERRVAALQPDDLATLIYTSGTTGPPKGVMLSQRNLTWTSDAAAKLTEAKPDEIVLSYLPLSHIAEQLFSVHIHATVGYTLNFAESLEALPNNLKEVRPTMLFGVPRIWEKVEEKLRGKLAETEGFKAKVASWAQEVGRRVNDRKNRDQPLDLALKAQYTIANKLFFNKVKEAMGLDRTRFFFSGAAPIADDVLWFFAGLDIPIREVYGQTEDSGPATFNTPGQTRLGSVGRPLPGTEVEIADDGEILVRGPHVFLGYYRDERATKNALEDGWLHTGDVGTMNPKGFVRITGRKKEIIVTSGGKNITPVNIEQLVVQHPLVSQAVLIGDRRKYISALLTLSAESARQWVKTKGLEENGTYCHPALLEELERHIDKEVNSQFGRVEHIRRFSVLPEEFSIESGELTPTTKLKRSVIHERHALVIDQMYEEGHPPAACVEGSL